MTGLICPRRVLELGPWSSVPDAVDSWQDRTSMVYDTPWSRPACSHCGSLHPSVLMRGIREGKLKLGGTDKAYKWYVEELWDDARWEASKREWFQSEVVSALKATGQDPELYWQTHMAGQSWRGSSSVAKFYTPHLSRAQAAELLDLWAAGKLAHSMYVQPWLPSMSSDAPEWLIAGTPDL